MDQVSSQELEGDLNMDDKWKTTSIYFENGKRTQFFGKIKDDLNFREKWKTT
jgi:hypothetical protein